METELRLGLPGGGGGRDHHDETTYSLTTTMSSSNITSNAHGKRCFDETVDLKLKLSDHTANMKSTKHLDKDSVKTPAAKAQVVGWPPVRSYRKNVVASQKSSGERQESSDKQVLGNGGAALVKVSMDGAPYLRKVDLNMYKTYQDLSHALASMFNSFTIGNCEVQGMKDFMNESKLMDLLNTSEYVPTYEDKDGDWMLVGDVPWRMFVESCKRLRIMKGTEAKGLAPKAMEKCKNRN